MVHTDGTVTTCCLDEHMENRLGNTRETPLASLWYGPRIHSWRVAQVEGRFHESGPFCTRCDWRSAGAYPVEKARAYLEWYASWKGPEKGGDSDSGGRP